MSYLQKRWTTVRDGRDRRAHTPLLVFHTTGSGKVVEGLDKGRDPNLFLPDYYDEPGADGPHECITYEGFAALVPGADHADADAWVIREEEDFAPHAGIGMSAIELYRKGFDVWSKYTWDAKNKTLVPHSTTLERYQTWRKRFPNLQSPLDLLPKGVVNPNECSYSWEMIQPVAKKPGGGWKTVGFTPRMHDVAAWRAMERVSHYHLPRDLEALHLQIVGHEDLHPIVRTDDWGPWDPGAGPRKLWDWDLFFARLAYWMQVPSTHPASDPSWRP